MRSIETDVLVIGGGATGAGVQFDLAQRGLRVVMAEMNDIATGTSGRYHGLLHSGGRYAVRDQESAKECADENVILRRIAPHAIEDTGGLFVAFRNDPPDYVDPFKRGCTATGIPWEEISIREALKLAPAMDPTAVRAIRVPDAALDSFDLVHSIVSAAEQHGAKTLTYHKVISFEQSNGRVTGALLENRKTGEQLRVHTRYIINASGPWASEIGKLFGSTIKMRHSKGIMIAMNVRWVHTIINRLKPPADGDILVPVGTVCVIGTTSITVPRPDDYIITPQEVSQMMDDGEVMIPGFRNARALRVWAGVRPLYEDPNGANMDSEGREVKRTFDVLNHATRDGIAGIASIVGGKLTTYRLMAEKIADFVCKDLGHERTSQTATTQLPAAHLHAGRRLHTLPSRQKDLEQAPTHNGLICECEIVTRQQLVSAIDGADATIKLDDLRRDLRLGMGPCQAGFCGYRAAGVLQEVGSVTPTAAVNALQDFVQERFRGNRPLLWGHQLRQALLDETIYRRNLGLALTTPEGATDHG